MFLKALYINVGHFYYSDHEWRIYVGKKVMESLVTDVRFCAGHAMSSSDGVVTTLCCQVLE